MKRVVSGIFLLSLLLPLADLDAGIAVRANVSLPQGDFKDYSATGYGLEVVADLRPFPVPFLLMPVAIGYTAHGNEEQDWQPGPGAGLATQESSVTVSGGGLGLKLEPPALPLRPFLEVMGRLAAIEQDYDPGTDDNRGSIESETRFGFEIAGGLRYKLVPTTSLIVGARYTTYFNVGLFRDNTETEIDVNTVGIFVGARFGLGWEFMRLCYGRWLIPLLIALTLVACVKQEDESVEVDEAVEPVDTSRQEKQTPVRPPRAEYHFVFDPGTHTVFEIELTDNEISERFLVDPGVVAIAYDIRNQLIYRGYGGSKPGIDVFDPATSEVVKSLPLVEPITDLLYDPIVSRVYAISQDSTAFIEIDCDSMKIAQDFPLHVVNKGFVGPIRLSPGPAGKLITANGDRASVTQIFTQSNYMHQTVINSLADRIDHAVFSRNGQASYSCDVGKGMVFKVQFGTGEVLAQREGFDRPRHIQIEVRSNTVIVVTGQTDVLMLHPDTFVETGRKNLSDFGDAILNLEIPPKANFAELIMTYRGVKRWLRFDINTWENTRLIELL
jgi:hypothetical protein